MTRFDISIFGIRMAARGIAGIIGLIVVLAMLLGWAAWTIHASPTTSVHASNHQLWIALNQRPGKS